MCRNRPIFGKNYGRELICDDCIQYIKNIAKVLKEMHDGVLNYKHEFKTSLKDNENEIKNLLEAFETRM